MIPGILTVKHDLRAMGPGKQFMQASPGDAVIVLTTMRPLFSAASPRSASVASNLYLCYKRVPGTNQYILGWLPVYSFQDGETLEQAWKHTDTALNAEHNMVKKGAMIQSKVMQWAPQEHTQLNAGRSLVWERQGIDLLDESTGANVMQSSMAKVAPWRVARTTVRGGEDLLTLDPSPVHDI